MTAVLTSDAHALDRIAELLDGVEWTPDHLDLIAMAVRSTGRVIRDTDDVEPGEFRVTCKDECEPDVETARRLVGLGRVNGSVDTPPRGPDPFQRDGGGPWTRGQVFWAVAICVGAGALVFAAAWVAMLLAHGAEGL